MKKSKINYLGEIEAKLWNEREERIRLGVPLKWHVVTGNSYTRHDSIREALYEAVKVSGRVVNGDVHDKQIGILWQ